MNYKKIYHSIVDRAKARNLDCYTESHHIIPKCIGGEDSEENLVNLTPEEHYVCHQLLVKMYPGNRGLLFAAFMMGNPKSGRGSRNNKEYAWVRKRFAKTIKESKEGKTKAEITGNPNWVNPAKGISRAEFLKKPGYVDPKSKPFKLITPYWTKKYNNYPELKRDIGVDKTWFRKLVRQGYLVVQRADHRSHHPFKKGDKIKVEYL